MSQLVELERRREELQKKANVARANRDKLNNEARSWAQKRDELNAQVRGFVEEANEHRRKRDEFNESVKRHKKTREEDAKAANELKDRLEELKRDRLPKGGRPVHVIKKQIQKLEFEQQTKVLKSDKERELIESLQALYSELKQKEDSYHSDPELKQALEAYDQARERAEKAHQKVSETADKAQSEHEAMVKLFAQSDRIRKDADKLQEKFVTAKLEADRVHKEYIGIVNQIHEAEKEIQDQRKSASEPSEAEVSAAEDRADDVYEKFKRGEKLSTEDLMTLQKAGLL